MSVYTEGVALRVCLYLSNDLDLSSIHGCVVGLRGVISIVETKQEFRA